MADKSAAAGTENQHLSSVTRKLRSVLVVLLVAAGCLMLSSYIFIHWVERQVLTTDNWVAAVGPLPQQPVVAKPLAAYVTAQIFTNVPVQQEIADALPPKAAFLASPLTSQLRSIANQTVYRVVVSDTFINVWTAANRSAMNQLVGAARGQKPPLGSRLAKFSLNLNSIKQQIAAKLGTTAGALPSLNAGSGNNITFVSSLKAKRTQVWNFIRYTDFLYSVLPFAVLACFLGAIALAERRRRTVVFIAGTMLVLLLLDLISVKVLRQSLLSQVKVSSNQPAIAYMFDALDGSLRRLLYSSLAIWLLVLIGGLVVGPATWAVKLRSAMHVEWLGNTRVVAWWHAAREWVRRYQYYLMGGIGILFLVWLAFLADINGRLVVNGLLTALSLAVIIYMAAHPHTTRHRAST